MCMENDMIPESIPSSIYVKLGNCCWGWISRKATQVTNYCVMSTLKFPRLKHNFVIVEQFRRAMLAPLNIQWTDGMKIAALSPFEAGRLPMMCRPDLHFDKH
jgi:hypothetical protein